MTDYCQVPPYVIQNIPPNVLILLDVSRSMQYFAYYDGSNTPGDTSDDRLCNNSALPCTNFTSARPAVGYYGYFDPNQWYTYGAPGDPSNVFVPRVRAELQIPGPGFPELADDAADRRHAEGAHRRETRQATS